MAFIGNTNTTQAFTPAIDYFSGNASTTAFTLSRPVASVAQVQAVISNVPQDPGSAYTVSGSTITFTSAPPSGTNNIYVYYTSPITQVIAPGQGTVGTTQIQNGVTVNFADGSAAAPSITNDGDTNTGIFFPAADTIAFSEGGAEAMRIDSSGNVGIGTTSPSYKLDVRGTVGFGDGANGVAYFNGGATAYAGLYLQYAGTTKGMIRGDGSGGDLVFSGTGTTEQMRLTSAAVLQFNSGYGSVATAYGCRAWVNFNGAGTVAIRASGNVSSITDNGTGDYTVNFTTSMPDVNYGYALSGSQVGANISNLNPRDAGFAVGSFRIETFNIDATPAARDYDLVSVSIFR